MKVTENPLVMLIEECIRLRDTAQEIFSPEGEYSLTHAEELVMLSISEQESPVTVPKIGRHLGYSRQVAKRAVDRLVELGLVEKLPNPDHKTAMLVRATRKGIAYEAKAGEVMLGVLKNLLSDSDLKKCLRLRSDLKKLRALLEQYQSGS